MQNNREYIKQNYLDINQTSHILGLDKAKVYQLCYSDKLENNKYTVDGIKKIFISKESIEDYAQEHSINIKTLCFIQKEPVINNDYYTVQEAANALNLKHSELLGVMHSGALDFKNSRSNNSIKYIISKESVQRYKDFLNNKEAFSSLGVKSQKVKLADILDIKTLLLLLPNFKQKIEQYKDKSLEAFVIDTIKTELKNELTQTGE